MKKLTREWVDKAEDDLAVVAKIAKVKPALNDAVCFHCQQAAEKYLKALMQELGLPIPRIHDLLELVNRLEPHEGKVKPLRRGLGNLSDYAVEFRYPSRKSTATQSAAAQRKAKWVRQLIRSLLPIKTHAKKKPPKE